MHTLGIDTLVTLVAYIVHGIRRDTTNHFEQDRATTAPAVAVAVAALIVGEIGGFTVLLAGFVAEQFF
jgi:hypothetical protein